MKFHCFLFLLFLFIHRSILAQNLVPNPGFEAVSDYNFSGAVWNPILNEFYVPRIYCIQNNSDYLYQKNCTYKHKLLNWYTKSFTFFPINLKAYVQTPEGDKPKFYDLPKEQPLEGDGAFSIRAYTLYTNRKSAPDSLTHQQCNYLNNTLKSPLEAGKKYYVEFFVKLLIDPPDITHFYPSEIGLLFSDDIRPYTAQEKLDLENSDFFLQEVMSRQIQRPASVSSLPNRFYGIDETWQRVCGFYTAKGGEQYIAIGNFNQNEMWYYSHEYGVINAQEFHFEIYSPITGDLLIDNVRVEEYTPGMFFGKSKNGEINVCTSDLPYQLSLADSFSTYNWQNGTTEKTLDITNSGYYKVELDAFGCMITDSVKIEIENNLQIDIKDTLLCPQQLPLVVSSVANDSIHWSNGSTTIQTQYNQPGKYWLTLANSCGIVTDTFNITTIDTAEFKIPISKKILFCTGNPIDTLVQIPSYFQTVNWKDDDTSHQKRFTDTATYSVNLANRCVDTTFYFSLNYYPENISLSDTFSCEGIPLQLPISKDYTSYRWNTGDTSSTIYPSTSGNYMLTVQTPCGQWSDSLYITHIPLHPKTIQNDTLICTKGIPIPITFSISMTNWDTIQWYTGRIDSSITTTQVGEIYVTTKNRCQTRIDTAQVVACATDLDYSINAPNIITPNGDSKNDCFSIEYYNIEIEELTIYSRYGKLIDKIQSSIWCPQLDLSSGIYYYLFTFKTPSNTTQYLKGWIMVQE